MHLYIGKLYVEKLFVVGQHAKLQEKRQNAKLQHVQFRKGNHVTETETETNGSHHRPLNEGATADSFTQIWATLMIKIKQNCLQTLLNQCSNVNFTAVL